MQRTPFFLTWNSHNYVTNKLAEWIGRWEYIEMYELLPEFWPSQKATEEGTSKRSNRSTAKKRVQDINVWLQCYAMYVGVLATKSPDTVPEPDGVHDKHPPG